MNKIYIWSNDVATTDTDLLSLLVNRLAKSLFTFKSINQSQCDDNTTMYLSGSLMGLVDATYSNRNASRLGCLAGLFMKIDICKIDAQNLNISDYIDYCVDSKIDSGVAYLFSYSSIQYSAPIKSLKIPTHCCNNMYKSSSLRIAPDILATEISSSGCYCMFNYCDQLITDKTHPYIAISDISKLGSYGFNFMFYHCFSVNELQFNFTNVTNDNIIGKNQYWLDYTKSTGKFYTISTCDWPSGANGIPTGWTRINTDE